MKETTSRSHKPLDTLSLVTPLSLLISLSFLKPLSIVFQYGIWSVCFNVVVWKRIQRKKKKREKCQKEDNKKSSHQILRNEMEGRNTALKKKKRWKKKCWMEIPKRVDIPTNLENTSYIYLHPFLFYSLYFYPTLSPNKVLIWSWRLCSSDIDMTEKKKVWCEYFWHPFMRLLVLSWLSLFHVIYMWDVWFCLHYSAHIYCWECYTLFQSDFICWVITPERIELKHTFK